jgi:hypothetical protein
VQDWIQSPLGGAVEHELGRLRVGALYVLGAARIQREDSRRVHRRRASVDGA